MRTITRRQAVYAALSGIVTSSSSQAAAQLGAAIIGTAHSHALGHLEAIRDSEHYRFIAAAEPDPVLLEKAQANPRWQGVRWASVDEILSDDAISMVCIETDPLRWSGLFRQLVGRFKVDSATPLNYRPR